jgi:hypothetical protein
VRALTASTATQLAAAIRAKAVSPVEVMEAHLARIASVNPKLNAIVTRRDGDEVMAEARTASGTFARYVSTSAASVTVTSVGILETSRPRPLNAKARLKPGLPCGFVRA